MNPAVDRELLTIFIALTALAILIQTGIVAGMYFAVWKMTKQTDRAFAESKRLLGPVRSTVDSLVKASERLADLSASSRKDLGQYTRGLDRAMERIRRKTT